jgi:hypothetical protein
LISADLPLLTSAKGAAIGAIRGGTGGFVYDRMTRRNNMIGVPDVR